MALAIWDLLWFHTNFKIIFFQFHEKCLGMLIGTAFNLWIVWGHMNILVVVVLPVYKPSISFICVIFSYFDQCFIIFRVWIFHLLG